MSTKTLTIIAAFLVGSMFGFIFCDVTSAAPRHVENGGPCVVKRWNGGPYAFCRAHTCVTINNRTNTASWINRFGTGRASYSDYGDNLGYAPVPPRAAHAALNAAEAKLRVGKPGFKIARACA